MLLDRLGVMSALLNLLGAILAATCCISWLALLATPSQDLHALTRLTTALSIVQSTNSRRGCMPWHTMVCDFPAGHFVWREHS